MLDRRTFALTGLSLTAGLAAAGLAGRGARADGVSQKETFKVTKTDAEWKAMLTPEQYNVLRRHGTERAGTSPLDKTYAPGTYHCAGCNQALFTSETKFDSGTGWPSFYQPIDGATGSSTDFKLIYPRTEIHCSRCGGHLGHVFNDGPAPTGKRYCMNGVAMTFVPSTEEKSGS